MALCRTYAIQYDGRYGPERPTWGYPLIAHLASPADNADVRLALHKLIPPALPESLLTRHRLNRLLSRANKKSITLVRAPAGFGKTTAVADWVRRNEDNHRFVWLTAQQEDDEPRRFWPGFVEALATLEPLPVAEIRHKLSEGSVLNGESLATELVNSLHLVREPITVVIDDFEKISSGDVMKWFAFTVRALPPNVRLVLCTRSKPEIPLSAWRADGRLSEITQEHLKFTDQEAGAYLDSLVAGAISEEQERALLEKTEGWIAALYLAALGIQHAPDVTTFLSDFGEGHETISGYVVDEVLARLPETLRSFLLQTSITKTMTPPLCDSITGRTDSEAMLRALTKHGIFVTNHQSGSWSYHPLFREVLRTLLCGTVDRTEVADLHRRAAQQYLAHTDYAKALDHAFAADELDLAQRILADHHENLLLTNPNTVHEALAEFPEDHLAKWPQGRSIQIAAAAVLADTDTLLAIAGRESIDGARTLELVSRSVLRYLDGDYVRLAALLTRSAKGMHPVAGTALRGLIETADERYESGAALLRSTIVGRSTDHFTAAAATGILAWNRVRAGYLTMGKAYARRALSFADGEGTRWVHWVRWAELAQAQARLDQGQLDDALSESAAMIERASGDQWSRVEAHLLAARINRALGKGEVAAEHLAVASSSKGPIGGPLADLIALTNAHFALLDEDLELAVAWLPDWQTRAAAGPTGELERLVIARLLIGSQLFEESLDLLHGAESDSLRSMRYLVESQKLHAIAAARTGDSSAPLLLEVALATARTEGFVQTFVDDWRSLAIISRSSDMDVLGPATNGKHSKPANLANTAKTTTMVEPLTDRELAVLRLLPTRMTNQRIAEELFISINTVKTHLKAIYRKLEVDNRNGAVDAAVSMGIV